MKNKQPLMGREVIDMNLTIDSMEQKPEMKTPDAPKSYNFGTLPVKMEEKVILPERQGHEELLHWHDDLEIIRIRRGNVHCHVNDSDFLLGPGELCFINFNVMHRVYNTDKREGDLDALLVRADMLSQNKEIYEKYIVPIIRNPEFAHVKMDGRNSYARLISDIFDDLYQLIKEQPAGYELDVVGYIYMMFRRLYLAYTANEDLPEPVTGDTALQRKMATFIYEHYGEKVSLDDIAAAAGVSKSKCASLFRKYTQKSPISFLLSYRLEMAGRMLAETDEPMSAIAGACGFSEQSYFNRMFQREFGCTPSEWRKKDR